MSNSKPSTILRIGLPTGGNLLASAALKMQSAECSATSKLLLQVAPWIASISCQLSILKLIQPLIAIIEGLPNPPIKAVQDFSKAALELAPCLLAPAPSSVLPFVRDLLCLEIRSLNCFLGDLQAVRDLAATDPNSISESDVQNVINSYEPNVGILDLAGEFFAIAGVDIPQAPTLATATDLESLAADQTAVANFVTALQLTADSLGGCA